MSNSTTTNPHHCTDPEHHVHGADSFVDAVRDACDERDLRLTPIREQVLELIAGSEKPLKAYDLLEMMKGGVGASAPPTIYRTLDFLLENGFIHKLESVNAYVACHHPAIAHAVPFLICTECHTAIELEDSGIAADLEVRAKQLGFEPSAKIIEVHGRCANCSQR